MILLFRLMKLLWGVTNLQPQGIGTCTLARRKEHRKCRGSCLFAAPWVYPPQAATRTLAFRASCKLNSRRSLHSMPPGLCWLFSDSKIRLVGSRLPCFAWFLRSPKISNRLGILQTFNYSKVLKFRESHFSYRTTWSSLYSQKWRAFPTTLLNQIFIPRLLCFGNSRTDIRELGLPTQLPKFWSFAKKIYFLSKMSLENVCVACGIIFDPRLKAKQTKTRKRALSTNTTELTKCKWGQVPCICGYQWNHQSN